MAHCQRWITISLLAGSEGTLSATWWLMCEAVVLESAASGASLQPNQLWLQQSSLHSTTGQNIYLRVECGSGSD